jgi:hypothetical protein
MGKAQAACSGPCWPKAARFRILVALHALRANGEANKFFEFCFEFCFQFRFEFRFDFPFGETELETEFETEFDIMLLILLPFQ